MRRIGKMRRGWAVSEGCLDLAMVGALFMLLWPVKKNERKEVNISGAPGCCSLWTSLAMAVRRAIGWIRCGGSRVEQDKGAGMAGSVNKVILVGNLGKDPETRRMASGEPVVSFRIATSETWRDKQSGERREKTEWHSIVIFNENLAKIAEQYLRKGSKVYVEGQLQTREWTDKDNQKRYSTEVVLQRFRGELTLLDGRDGGGGREVEDQGGGSAMGYDRGGASAPRAAPSSARPASGGGGRSAPIDDDIPF
jgi:single-strand DNA-binding protein